MYTFMVECWELENIWSTNSIENDWLDIGMSCQLVFSQESNSPSILSAVNDGLMYIFLQCDGVAPPCKSRIQELFALQTDWRMPEVNQSPTPYTWIFNWMNWSVFFFARHSSTSWLACEYAGVLQLLIAHTHTFASGEACLSFNTSSILLSSLLFNSFFFCFLFLNDANTAADAFSHRQYMCCVLFFLHLHTHWLHASAFACYPVLSFLFKLKFLNMVRAVSSKSMGDQERPRSVYTLSMTDEHFYFAIRIIFLFSSHSQLRLLLEHNFKFFICAMVAYIERPTQFVNYWLMRCAV